MRHQLVGNEHDRQQLGVISALRTARTALLASLITFGLASAVALNSQAASVKSNSPTWPTSETILAEFAPPNPDWLPGHRGLDLAASQDGTVRTPAVGVVIWRGFTGSIPVLVIRHGITRATYQPITSNLAVGSIVQAGQIVGSLTSGGHCSNRCLHWGLKLNDRYLDPRLLLWRPHPILVSDNNSRGKS
jgi:murein DD-endopeptidase MepM/ murein hydrolase activator NlpD